MGADVTLLLTNDCSWVAKTNVPSGVCCRNKYNVIVAGDLLLWCTRFVRECTRAREFVVLYAHKLSIHDRVSGTALAT
jgi:hypothetical protein